MINRYQTQAARVHGRVTLRWLVCLSGALHVALFVCLLAFPAAQPPPNGAEPLFVDIIVEKGPDKAGAEPPALPAATAAVAAPAAEVAPAETSPPTPASAPDVPPFQPLEQTETPPPIPAPVPELPPPPAQLLEASPAPPAPSSDVLLASPIQEADQPPPPPSAPLPDVLPPQPVQSAPPPMPPPLPRVGPVRPPAAQPQATPARPAAPRQAAIRAPVNPAGAVAPAADGKNTANRVTTANNGAAWMGKLKQWWDQHSFYPKEASQTNDGGDVRVRIVIAADGQVSSIEVVQGSGSRALDAAALAVFRNARLPPFPPGTIAQPADIVVTLHYRPSDTGE